MKNKVQLGKGMAALLGANGQMTESKEMWTPPTELATKPVQNIDQSPLMVDVSMIHPNKNQPRKIFKEKDLVELADSIKENGIIQPLIVSQSENGTSFDLIAGERRLRAAKLAGLTKVPVVLRRVTKRENLIVAIIENVQRSDLNCVEEGLAYFQLMSEFQLTQEEVAKRIGKERSTVANFLRILKLPKEVLMFLQKEQLSFGHAKILVGITEDESIKRLAHECVENKLSVRELEELIKKTKNGRKASEPSKFVQEQYTQLRAKLEQKTGYHFEVKAKNNGAGQIAIKFSNEAEFNDIFSYLMK